MAVSGLEHNCGEQQSAPGGDPRDGTCRCCDHQECSTFARKKWYQRLYTIRIGRDDDPEDNLFESSTVGTAIRDTLATRSYRDFLGVMTHGAGCPRESVLVVMLEEGELPLTGKDVSSWSNHAATASSVEEPCYVGMTEYRNLCCLFGAENALSKLLQLESSRSDQPLLDELMGEVKSALSLAYGEANVEQRLQQYKKEQTDIAWKEWERYAQSINGKREMA